MTFRLNGSTSGFTEIDSPAVAGNNTLILPTGNGTSGQVLSTNGSGTLSWIDTPDPTLTLLRTTDLVGADVTAPQTMFNATVNVVAGVTYRLEGFVYLTKTTGIISHQMQITTGGGTASRTSLMLSGVGVKNNDANPISGATSTANSIWAQSSGSTVTVFPLTAVANVSVAFHLRGLISVTTSGTFFPQYTLTVAPGGAYTVKAGSHLSLIPV